MTTGSSRRAAAPRVSRVADMTMIRRSGLRAPASRHRARARSPFRFRSWNSSKTTRPVPDSSGSPWILRVRIPSVRTSIRVDGETFLSIRTW